MKTVIALYVSLTVYASAEAQTHGVVVDLQTGRPLSGVKIHTDVNRTVSTDEKGHFDITFTFRSATVANKRYVSRTFSARELRDTVRLLPTNISLNEVIVYGSAPKINPMILRDVKQSLVGMPKGGGLSFDFFSLFRKKACSSKERERRRKAIENY